MLRTLALVAAFVALAAFGLAVGDFASDPGPLGAAGLIVLAVVIFLAFSRLFGEHGVAAVRRRRAPGEPEPRRQAKPRPEPEPGPAAEREAAARRRRRSRQRPTSAELWLDDDGR